METLISQNLKGYTKVAFNQWVLQKIEEKNIAHYNTNMYNAMLFYVFYSYKKAEN